MYTYIYIFLATQARVCVAWNNTNGMPRTEYSQIFVLSESTGDGMLGLFRPGSAECPRIAPTPLSHFYAPWRLALDWTLGKLAPPHGANNGSVCTECGVRGATQAPGTLMSQTAHTRVMEVAASRTKSE
jgi:hypothetical protein